MAKGEVREHVKSLMIVMASDVTIVFIESQFFGSDILANTFFWIFIVEFFISHMLVIAEWLVRRNISACRDRLYTSSTHSGRYYGEKSENDFSITAVPWFLCSVV